MIDTILIAVVLALAAAALLLQWQQRSQAESLVKKIGQAEAAARGATEAVTHVYQDLQLLTESVRELKQIVREAPKAPDVTPVQESKTPAPLPMRLQSLSVEARQIGQITTDSAKVQAELLAEYADSLTSLLSLQELHHSTLERLIGVLYTDPYLMPTWTVKPENQRLPEITDELRQARAELVERYRVERQVEPIYPIPRITAFDPNEHVDAGGSPGMAQDQNQDNLVLEVLRPGIKYQGKVAFQAKVFRVRVEQPAADLPEVQLPKGDVGW